MGRTARTTFALGALAVAIAGCASVRAPHPDDPWERYNRSMFAVNEAVDKAVVKPLAQGYDTVAPLPVKAGVGNFFGNLRDIWTGVNNLLQGKGGAGATDAARVLVNSTLGIFGVFDVATEMGLDKHEEDLGQTLAVWGVDSGPYFVLPFFGPRMLRDAAAFPADYTAGQPLRLSDVGARNALSGLQVVHVRYTLLGADRAAEEASLDKYAYVRDFYMQQRRYEIHDGHPPRERFDDARAPLQPAPLALVEADAVADRSLGLELVALSGPRH